jgi:DNA-binding MarR family transcriptional regulator
VEHSYDPVLLSQVRLGIVTVLITRKDATFSDLKSLLGLTQGNLGIHLQKLEEAGYVATKKAFVKRKPRTTVRITPRGRDAFLRHVEQLEKVARALE